MRDVVRESLKGIGQNQRRIILWLGRQQEVTRPENLRERWPATDSVDPLSLINPTLASVAELSKLFQSRWQEVPTEYAPYLEDSYFYESSDPPADEGWVRWSPEGALGVKPTASQSSSISTALRMLEERGLVETLKLRGKKQRISHVKLTFKGEVASVLLHKGSERFGA